jgi:5,5'-dehydrodivanillate O-demethylase
MISSEKNELLTRVGPATPMGGLLRRYWMPIAGISQLDEQPIKPIRLMGEDLVLYRDLSGNLGLINRFCTHRRADLSFGMVESAGLRCSYHGWKFDAAGACVEQPYEDVVFFDRPNRRRPDSVGYPVQAKAGVVWAYLGPLPVPLIPEWELFSWSNGFAQVVISEIPCNWLQCQENSIDPVHFEWMHDNWGARLRDGQRASASPRHLRLAFEEFEYGYSYKRVREDSTEQDPSWTVGRVCLWPNAFFLGSHFEWRVPIDDENTLSVTWHFTHVPKEREPYDQPSIPTWVGPTHDSQGRWITTHVMNQDFTGWVGQGRIADRTREHLGASDSGIVMIRKRLMADLDAVAQGHDPKGIIRDPSRNVRIELPSRNGSR